MTTIVEMRCPVDSQRMFGKIMSDAKPVIVTGNLLEFACSKCRRRIGTGQQVLHRFDLTGRLVETEIVDR
jgi:hypothetical protein